MRYVPLHSICRPKQWKTIAKKQLLESGIPVYGANGVIGFTDSFTHEEPTLMIGCRGSCGKVHTTEGKAWINGNAMALDSLSSEVDMDFLKYQLEWRGFEDVISGSSQPQITGQGLKKVSVFLPPLEEQKRIAGILDEADRVREKTQALIDKYDELGRSLFLDMFGDPVTNPKGWQKQSFTEIFDIKTGKLDSHMAVDGGEFPFFTCAKSVSRIDRYSFDQEALLLAGNNAAGVYDVKHFRGKFDAYQRTYVLTLRHKGAYPFFRFQLEQLLQKLQSVSIGSGTKYLTLKILGRITMLNPNDVAQDTFTERVRFVEEQKNRAVAEMNMVEILFDSLLQKAFKGELT